MIAMMEEMDNLDEKLLSNTFKRNPSMEDSKKRITFAGLIHNINQYILFKSNKKEKSLICIHLIKYILSNYFSFYR